MLLSQRHLLPIERKGNFKKLEMETNISLFVYAVDSFICWLENWTA